ncbi:hypothetical protein DL764_001974 [Monosporascus ibericus]|uniref:Uncharacterized protein n=1 Tax=Monosporascus ibericus TaxID=155417 RepID=A0A4Q4TNV4_9PEZI|nr:hypothetical protein DL764_001974 [Monosporascus ibericus]
MSPLGWYMAIIASLAIGVCCSTLANYRIFTYSSRLVPSSPPIEGYGVTELEWEVPVRLGQDPVTLNGTVEQVYAQLLELNPEYDVEIGAFDVSETATFATPKVAESGLEKRDRTVCGNFSTSYRGPIRRGIAYLRGMPGTATNSPGSGNCGKVSCADAGQIWWCNDTQLKAIKQLGLGLV